jgi:hypothetical protein
VTELGDTSIPLDDCWYVLPNFAWVYYSACLFLHLCLCAYTFSDYFFYVCLWIQEFGFEQARFLEDGKRVQAVLKHLFDIQF